MANYLTTLAIGLFVAEVRGLSGPSGGAEITATLILAPVVFVFGELIPKSLYNRAPLSLLHSGSLTFQFFYYLFLPFTYPLTLMAGTISRVMGPEIPAVDIMFGRTRTFGLIASGKRDGILTRTQARTADNLMACGGQTLADLMGSPDLISRVPESCSRERVLAVDAAGGNAWIFLHPDRKPNEWTGTVRVAHLAVVSTVSLCRERASASVL